MKRQKLKALIEALKCSALLIVSEDKCGKCEYYVPYEVKLDDGRYLKDGACNRIEIVNRAAEQLEKRICNG